MKKLMLTALILSSPMAFAVENKVEFLCQDKGASRQMRVSLMALGPSDGVATVSMGVRTLHGYFKTGVHGPGTRVSGYTWYQIHGTHEWLTRAGLKFTEVATLSLTTSDTEGEPLTGAWGWAKLKFVHDQEFSVTCSVQE